MKHDSFNSTERPSSEPSSKPGLPLLNISPLAPQSLLQPGRAVSSSDTMGILQPGRLPVDYSYGMSRPVPQVCEDGSLTSV